jgi:hypothetical protein
MFPVDNSTLTIDEAMMYSFCICLLIASIWLAFARKPVSTPSAQDLAYPPACDMTFFEIHSGKCRNAEKIGGKISCGNPNCKHF